MDEPIGFPPMTELIPHAGPMVMLDAMTRWAPGEAECRLVIRAGMPFVVDGRVDTTVAIEWMAQAVAACLGYEAFRGGEGTRVGMIIGCRRFDLLVPVMNVGDVARVVVKRIRGNESLSHFDAEILLGEDQKIAAANLTLYPAEKPPEDV
jgi:predicted hotdog family 3-hydroxylacyl-ACP dehydratase